MLPGQQWGSWTADTELCAQVRTPPVRNLTAPTNSPALTETSVLLSFHIRSRTAKRVVDNTCTYWECATTCTDIPEMEPDCVKPTVTNLRHVEHWYDRAPLRSMNQHRGSATLSYGNNTKYWLNHYQHYHFVMNHFQSSVQSTTRQEYHCCSKRSQDRSTPFLFYT